MPIKNGHSESLIKEISRTKGEPAWMLENRQGAYTNFLERPMPKWGADLSEINFDDITYYVRPSESKQRSWSEVSSDVKTTFDKLGIPEAEQKFLSGVEAQFDSEAIYGSLMKELEDQGVIFTDMDTALRKYPKLIKEYFGTIVPANDNKFAALNTAFWSGGSFVYIPKGVHVKRPLQAYFRINARQMGQFERTLIIADEGSFATYVEGCTAPSYSEASLHAAVVEVVVKKGARFRYTTIQNWSNNVYNLVTKRAYVEEKGVMEWIDGNLGSKVTMKYPACILAGEGARGEMLSLAYASEGQVQDAGSKMIHLAPNTSSKIVSKSVSTGGGVSSYRGLVHISPKATGVKNRVECDALLLDDKSISNTFPVMRNFGKNSRVEHEASVSKVSEDQLLYLQSRGLSEDEALSLVVSGFMEPIVKQLPMEYAVELNRLIELEMEGSVG
jgi:Fe-S cluster assembly protein SufB